MHALQTLRPAACRLACSQYMLPVGTGRGSYNPHPLVFLLSLQVPSGSILKLKVFDYDAFRSVDWLR